ncbi:alpha/beta hydrolase [Microbacterium caowuchunii]|uniref:alpha/beta fold hydrolase n=1 Tax=Microbacterium caowuchunii TaxID=2614638 RepID=UPI00124884C8|nr:alpha/beta hydrolase [Microbacterium caowuchunii]QEW01253.1 alpha/beta hydrolase [Microbacterium caowuchunii]
MSTDIIEIPGAEDLHVTLRSGAVAHAMAAGPQDGEPVILLHGGLPGSSGAAGWRFMLPALAEAGFRVYAPDRPGFGRSDTRPEHRPVRGHMSWVDFVIQFADAVGAETFRLGGNSQGAQTAAYVAVNHPERVTHLAMIATSGLNEALDVPAEDVVAGIPLPRWDGSLEGMRTMMMSIIHRKVAVTDEVLAMRAADAEQQRESFAAAAAWNRTVWADPNRRQLMRLRGRLDQLTIPIIYLYGRQDVLGPVQNGFLQEDRLPNVQFFYPDDCGHQGQTDQPEIFGAVFTEFFRDARVTADTAARAGVSDRRPVLKERVQSA